MKYSKRENGETLYPTTKVVDAAAAHTSSKNTLKRTVFAPAVASTSGRIHAEFICLLFLRLAPLARVAKIKLQLAQNVHKRRSFLLAYRYVRRYRRRRSSSSSSAGSRSRGRRKNDSGDTGARSNPCPSRRNALRNRHGGGGEIMWNP